MRPAPQAVRRFRRGVVALGRQLDEIHESAAQLQQDVLAAQELEATPPNNAERGRADVASDTEESSPNAQESPRANAPTPQQGAPPTQERTSRQEDNPTLEPENGECICEEYVDGSLVRRFPIPVGGHCGPYVCGRH
jgi:hypothetical protein